MNASTAQTNAPVQTNADIPQFGSPEVVMRVLDDIQRIETKRALDRALIDVLFNGGRPFGPEEVEKYQIQFNVNFNIGNRIIQDGNRQVNNALIPSDDFFKALSRGGTVSRRQDYSEKFTTLINAALKEGDGGRRHAFALKSRNASFVLHGIGAFVWLNDFRWRPKFIGLEDLLVPTNTLCDHSNLTHWGVNLYYTPGELWDMTHADRIADGWNIPAVERIMRDLKDDQGRALFIADERTWREQPEKIQEIVKQNRGWLDSDSCPKVKLRVFFYMDAKSGKWYRKIILRESTPSQPANKEFIYESKRPWADRLGHILHIQYGDNSIVPPLMHHSVRGLGVQLYSEVEADNRLRCQFLQHVFENLRMYFRKTDQVDRSVEKFLELYQYAVIQEGYSIIPQQERHQVDERIVDMAMNQLRDVMTENSASFQNSQSEQPTKRMTKAEFIGRLNTANVMISGMLDMAYMQEAFYYQEIVRRFCDPASTDPEVKDFRKNCVAEGIPEKLLTASNWKIVSNRVFGNGDPTLAHAQSEWLLENQQRFDPDAQRQILRIATSVTLNDPDRAAMLVPMAPPEATTGTYAAEDVFATLMRGIPVKLRQGIDHIGYAKALIGMMNVTIGQITQSGGVGTPEDVLGLITCEQEVQKHLQIVEAREENGPEIVKSFADKLGELMNDVKAFAQRQQEQAAAQNKHLDPEVMAKIQSMIAMDSVKLKSKEAQSDQKLRHNELKFQQNQRIKAGESVADAHLKAGEALADTQIQSMKATTEALNAPPEKNGSDEGA